MQDTPYDTAGVSQSVHNCKTSRDNTFDTATLYIKVEKKRKGYLIHQGKTETSSATLGSLHPLPMILNERHIRSHLNTIATHLLRSTCMLEKSTFVFRRNYTFADSSGAPHNAYRYRYT